MIPTGGLELTHILIHPADDLIVIFFCNLGVGHIPAGQFLGQNLIEYIVFVIGDGFMDATLHIGFGGDGDAVPILSQYIHFAIAAKFEELALQIVVISEAVVAPGGV